MAITVETISLKDNVSGPAKSAAAQVSSLSSEMQSLTKALTSAQSKMTTAAATGNVKAYKSAAADVTNLKTAISLLPPQSAQAAAAATKAADATQGMAGAADQAATSSAGMQSSLAELTGGLSVVVEVVGAVALGLGALAFAAVKAAISASQADAKMTSMFNALGEGQISGKQVVAMLDDMSSTLGIARDQLAPFTQQFMAMGVRSEDALKRMTTAAISAKAIMGDDSAANAFVDLQKKIQAASEGGQALKIKLAALSATGVDVADVAKKMGISAEMLGAQLKSGSVDATKFGNALQSALIEKGAGPLQAMGNELGNVWAKFGQDMNNILKEAAPAVAPFLAAVRDLFSIFDTGKNTTTSLGAALKTGVGGALTAILQSATKVVPMVKHFLLDLVILALKAYIALKPTIATIKDLWSRASEAGALSLAFKAVEAAAIAFGLALGVVVVVVGILMAASIAVGVVIWGLVGIIGAVGMSVAETLGGMIKSAIAWGSDFVDGLIGGIKGGIGKVTGAVSDLASAAKNAFKSALGIASPSKEMAKLGAFAGHGVAQGLDATQSKVASAGASVGQAAFDGAGAGVGDGPSAGAAPAPAAFEAATRRPDASPAPAAASRGNTTNTNTFNIMIDGAGKSAMEITEEMISVCLERMALAGGT